MSKFILMIAKKLSGTTELSQAKALLKESHLPVSDIDREEVEMYGFFEEEILIGSGAIEKVDGYRLLRSLAVKSDMKSKGRGSEIVRYLEERVAEEGLHDVYIITEIPEYFRKFNYKTINRETVPEEIRETPEYSVLCPDTAAVMTKEL